MPHHQPIRGDWAAWIVTSRKSIELMESSPAAPEGGGPQNTARWKPMMLPAAQTLAPAGPDWLAELLAAWPRLGEFKW